MPIRSSSPTPKTLLVSALISFFHGNLSWPPEEATHQSLCAREASGVCNNGSIYLGKCWLNISFQCLIANSTSYSLFYLQPSSVPDPKGHSQILIVLVAWGCPLKFRKPRQLKTIEIVSQLWGPESEVKLWAGPCSFWRLEGRTSPRLFWLLSLVAILVCVFPGFHRYVPPVTPPWVASCWLSFAHVCLCV